MWSGYGVDAWYHAALLSDEALLPPTPTDAVRGMGHCKQQAHDLNGLLCRVRSPQASRVFG